MSAEQRRMAQFQARHCLWWDSILAQGPESVTKLLPVVTEIVQGKARVAKFGTAK
ncbi:MAG: hypothetical protein KJO85_04670 [Gammaproteobacteria bacterium]|nr:hypothetical protein [Gammaproteobacteria bacterium]